MLREGFMKERYDKLKYIINRYYDCSLNKEQIVNKITTNDNVREAIKIFNRMDILSSSRKGVNKLKDNLFDKSIFKTKEYNSSIIASLAYAEEEKSKNIINYIFKEVPDNLIFMCNNNYSENFNDKVISLLDKKKFSFFATLINKNTDIYKVVCNVYDTSKNIYEKIAPLMLFIYNSSWYICAYDINKKEIIIINSFDISQALELKEICSSYINDTLINKSVEIFVKNSTKEEYFFLKFKPELLNIFLNKKLINHEYKVYEEITGTNDRNFFNDSKYYSINHKIRLSEIDTFNIEEYTSNYEILYFSKINSKKYIFKIKTSNIKYILKNFSDIEVIDIDEYII